MRFTHYAGPQPGARLQLVVSQRTRERSQSGSRRTCTLGMRMTRISLVSGLVFYRNQFDFKDERGVGLDGIARAAIAIGQLGRDDELPFGSHGHELESLSKTGDDSFDLERGRLPRPVRAVELGPIDQRSPVLAHDRVGVGGLLAFASLEDLVL